MKNDNLLTRAGSQHDQEMPASRNTPQFETNQAHVLKCRSSAKCKKEKQTNPTDFVERSMPRIAPRNITASRAMPTQANRKVKDGKSGFDLVQGLERKVDGVGYTKENRPAMPLTRVAKQAGSYPKRREGLPTHSRLPVWSSSMRSQMKMGKHVSRPPLPKRKAFSGKSPQKHSNITAKKTASSPKFTSRSRSISSPCSNLLQNGAAKQTVSHQVSLTRSNFQSSDGPENVGQDCFLMYGFSDNRNMPELPDENVGFCFTAENEPVMRRVLQELQHDFDSGFFNAGDCHPDGSGNFPSSIEWALNMSKCEERQKEKQETETEHIPLPNTCDPSGIPSISQSSEAFGYNHHQFPSPGYVPGNHMSEVQQLTQMNTQTSIAFPRVFPQSIVPSMITPAGTQAVGATNRPAWNPTASSQNHYYYYYYYYYYGLQPLVRGLDMGTLSTYQPYMTFIPRSIAEPTVLINPIQLQHVYYQHFGPWLARKQLE